MSATKTSGIVVFMLLLAIAAGGAYYLHKEGKLDGVIAKIRGGSEEALPPEPVEPVESAEEPVEVAMVPVEKPVETPVEPVEPVKPVEPVEKYASEADRNLAAKYRSRFKQPKIGSKVPIILTSKRKMTGVLQSLDDKGLSIKTDKVTMTLKKSQLAPVSRARCYEDDYVRYMVARHKYREYMQSEQAQRYEKMRAEYRRVMAKKGKLPKASSKPEKNKEVGSIHDVDFKKWMEENGATELLEARKARMREYERTRQAEGREF